MVSFSCEACQETVKKPKLDQHAKRGSCRNAGFSCIDCSQTFRTSTQWGTHVECISEAAKYEKSLYKGPKTKNNKDRNTAPNVKPVANQRNGTSTDEVPKLTTGQLSKNNTKRSSEAIEGEQSSEMYGAKKKIKKDSKCVEGTDPDVDFIPELVASLPSSATGLTLRQILSDPSWQDHHHQSWLLDGGIKFKRDKEGQVLVTLS